MSSSSADSSEPADAERLRAICGAYGLFARPACRSSAPPAGSAGALFLPEYVPIADRDASTLFLETRPGEHHGCISEYSATGAGSGPCRPSLSAMFTALADSLTTGEPFLHHRPRVEHGGLHWQPA